VRDLRGKIAHMHCDIVKLADQLRRQVGVVGDVPVHLLVRRRCHLHTHTHTRSITRVSCRDEGRSEPMQASAAPRAEGETQATPKHREVTHVLAVALREVDDARADGGEAHERAGAGVPQLRVEALLLCRHAHKHSAISLVRTPPRQELESKRIDSGGRAPGSSTQARQPRASERNTHLPPAARRAAAAARCRPRTTSSCPTTCRRSQNLIYCHLHFTPRPHRSTHTVPPPQIGRILPGPRARQRPRRRGGERERLTSSAQPSSEIATMVVRCGGGACVREGEGGRE
jgi:hypothetical protein